MDGESIAAEAVDEQVKSNYRFFSQLSTTH